MRAHRAAQWRPNHFSRAAGPADVLAGILNRDREIVTAGVVAFFSAGWTSRHIVVSDRAKAGADVVKDSECSGMSRSVQLILGFGWRKLRWHCLPGDQPGELLPRHHRKRIEVFHLRPDTLIGAVKPEALACSPVNTQRSTDGIAIPAGLQGIVLGEDFNPFLPAPLDRYTQPQGKPANVDPAVPGWERLRDEYPKMSATTAILKSRLHPILPEVEAELR